MSRHELEPTAQLLNAVFTPNPPITNDELNWFYRLNPEGIAPVGRVDKGGRQVGNYALIPTRFSNSDGRIIRLGLGVDLAVHPEFRRAGIFRSTVEASYRQGALAGLDGILGVANAQSSPRMVQRLGWRLLPPLPLRILVPQKPLGLVETVPIDAAFLKDGRLQKLLPEPTPATQNGFSTTWSADLLAWRLARPRRIYVLHIFDDLLAISTRISISGIPVAVVLKAVPRRLLEVPAPGGHIAGATAIYHRTPLVVHWGANPFVNFRGLAVPRNLLPRPLDLVLHAFGDNSRLGVDRDKFRISGFEFLDFDAY